MASPHIYTLYKVFTATADAAVNFMVIKAGSIRMVQWAIGAQLNADAEAFTVELGAVPTIQCRTNDSVGAISVCRFTASLLTSGGMGTGVNVNFPCDYPVSAMDKIYLHAVLAGTNSVDCGVLVYVV